ncbi:MAG TPA: zf-HC2 domain-containing protein [Bryobacteraceae bacterium]|nr:zf-HC2 domain-containing protein [Bryobacteraceae bacterium]
MMIKTHPEPADLLRFIDGELPARETREIQLHAEACWDCRTEIEELKKTVADCVRYRKDFLAEALPQRREPWADIYSAMARADRANQKDLQPSGLLQVLRGIGSIRWAVGALTAALAVAGAFYFGGGAPFRKAPLPVNVTEPHISTNNAGSGAAPLEVPRQPAVPSRPAAPAPGPPASISDELQVMKALHGIGADLGDPLRISLSEDHVLVAGVDIAPARQVQIETVLQPLDRVRVQFSNPAAPQLPAESEAAPSASGAASSPSPFQAKLETELGGKVALDRFAGEVLNWNDALTSHAYALRALAQRFPDDGALSGEDRAALHAIALDHISAMAAPLGNFDRALSPLLTALGATPASPEFVSEPTWQASAEQVFQASRSIEMLSSKLLGVARSRQAEADLPTQLFRAVNKLRAGLEQNQRLLGR